MKNLLGKIEVWGRKINHSRTLCLLLFVLSVSVTFFYKPFRQIVEGDSAIYDYISQAILRGQLPYRDIVDIKWPASVYLGAASIWVGDWFGIKDIFAIRYLQIAEFALLTVLIFLVAEAYLRNRMASLIAAIFPLLTPLVGWVVMGSQPKLPLLVFGMLSLLMLAKDRLLAAGVSSVLAGLCWQPGLLFTGTVGLVGSNYLTRWKDLRVLKVIIGALIPVAMVFGYFYLKGAFGDFWAWTVQYNYGVFGPDADRGSRDGVAHIWRVMSRILGWDIVFVFLGLLGFVWYASERLKARLQKKESSFADGWFRDALIFPPLVYFLFCITNMQGGPDLIPFIPFIGIFAGLAIVKLWQLLAAAKKLESRGLQWQAWAEAATVALLILTAFYRGARYKIQGPTLADEYRELAPIAEALTADDKIYIHGSVGILVLLKRPNLNPYVFLDWGADEFAASRKTGDFADIIKEMEAQSPKIISITRLKKVKYGEQLTNWVEANYQPFTTLMGDPVYIRR